MTVTQARIGADERHLAISISTLADEAVRRRAGWTAQLAQESSGVQVAEHSRQPLVDGVDALHRVSIDEQDAAGLRLEETEQETGFLR